MSWDILSVTTSAAVATNGTLTFAYPVNKNAGNYRGAYGHMLFVRGLMSFLSSPSQFTIAFGASNITVTYLGTTSIPANTQVDLQANFIGFTDERPWPITNTNVRMQSFEPIFTDFGAVATAVTNGVSTAQAVTVASQALTITGSLALNGVATFDVPRNVQTVSTNAGDTTQTVAFTGTDEYGAVMHQTLSLNGTTPVVGTKAFKTITGVVVSATTAGNISAGSGVVLGLPTFLAMPTLAFRESQDGAIPTAGTFVAGLGNTVPSATTGDVRGTWVPNATPNGTINFSVVYLSAQPSYLGPTQF